MAIKRFFIEGVDFIQQIFMNRRLIYELTKRDFKTQYANNLFGLSWAIVEPLAMMVILWGVFTFLRAAKSSEEVPYSIYILTGLISYDFFNKSINQGTRSIRTYSFLVKTVNFRLAVIPIIKIFSELLIHFIVVGIVIILLVVYHIFPSWYWFQFLYYLFAEVMLLIGVSWFTSSILPFFPDIAYIITIVMRMLFFMSPIFWRMDSFDARYSAFFAVNPLLYTVTGYRDSFLYHVPLWHHPLLTIYFWGFTGLMFLLGVVVFRRLKPHFADVI